MAAAQLLHVTAIRTAKIKTPPLPNHSQLSHQLYFATNRNMFINSCVFIVSSCRAHKFNVPSAKIIFETEDSVNKFHCFTVHFHSLFLLVPTNALFYFNTPSVSVTKLRKTLQSHTPTCFGQLMSIIRESFVPS
jgi:hypothetical protein